MSETILQLLKIILSSFVSIFIILHFMDRIFRRIYPSKALYLGTFLLGWLVLVGIAILENALISIVLSTILIFMIGLCLYDTKRSSDILILFLFFLFLVLTEVIGQFIVALIYSHPLSIAPGDMMQSLITFTCYQISIYFISKQRRTFHYATNWILLIVIPTISLFQIYVTLQLLNEQTNTATMSLAVISCMLTFIINVIVFVLFNQMATLHYENEQYQLLEQQKQMQYQYFNELEQNYEESQKFFHDIKNHLDTIEKLYQSEDSKTKEYVTTLKNKMQELNQLPPSNNRIINILIPKFISKTKTNQIHFSYHCEDLSFDFISDIDLNTIFTNILDNAFEECLNSTLKTKFIELSIGQINNFIVINLVNSCETIPISSDEKLLSQKEDHLGLGLINVQATIKKYHGIMDTYYENQIFTNQITFFNHLD